MQNILRELIFHFVVFCRFPPYDKKNDIFPKIFYVKFFVPGGKMLKFRLERKICILYKTARNESGVAYLQPGSCSEST